MTEAAATRSDYYVYLCRVAGRMVYVGKGCGYRMNRMGSHNRDLQDLLAHAKANSLPVRWWKLRDGLTEQDALRLEAKCFDKWRLTLLNRNNPYRALDLERSEAEWNAMDAAGEFDGFKVDTDRLHTLNDIAEGLITREAAIASGRLRADDEAFEEQQAGKGDPALRGGL